MKFVCRICGGRLALEALSDPEVAARLLIHEDGGDHAPSIEGVPDPEPIRARVF